MDALRAGMCARGRWVEADRLPGPDLAPGGPWPRDRPEWTVPARLANRGLDRAGAVRAARVVLTSADRVWPLWHGILVLLAAGERQAAWSYLSRARHDDVSALLHARLALDDSPAIAASLLHQLTVRPRLHEVAAAWHARALIACDDLTAAQEVLRRNGFFSDGGPELLMARGWAHFVEGRLDHAFDTFTACGRELTAWGVTNPAIQPWRSRAALCAHALGRPGLARALAQTELLAARRWGTGRAIGVAEHALAVVTGADPARLQVAVTTLDRVGATAELAEARHDLGRALAARGRVEEATRTLNLVRHSGNRFWAHRAESELDLDPASLTAQERSVAALARSGLSNREIAARLFLALRTVEFHLSGVYRKLGIDGRRDLGRVLAAL